MRIFRVLEGASCTVIKADEARNSMGPSDLHRKLRQQSARQDMEFDDGELVSDYVLAYNATQQRMGTVSDPIGDYILWALNRTKKRLCAFERGGWIAFYESKYVFE